ncbi:molybdate ABC transporter substrate-binding protein [Rhodobacteraceae bacterium KMM 6894]|nr:molybdate ABC transporter substrate-binding protein [Rhodobacteraceae bacterium KMM 6894]
MTSKTIMQRMRRGLVLTALSLMPFQTPALAQGSDAQVMVFVAASLTQAIEEVGQAYTQAHGGDVVVSAGGSGTVARQIAQGAPADVVMLANSDWMNWLTSEGIVDGAGVAPLLSNRLVLIAPADAPDLPDLSVEALLARLDGGRLAMGQTTSVPAGIYARAWLMKSGLWDGVQPALAETENVRAALALVALGEAPLGVVYATDAAAEAAVRVLYAVPEDPEWQITYPAAALTPKGQAFFDYLSSAEARTIFTRHGFIPLVTP